ncbi:hypothetical protein E2C01_018076 [Portunus trituberculatus]|uniref:Uncharacterized protein n=1 Tax=Portunus trituberculatus TaxID=210409 RepID=A0A5B7DTK6_PORTR|nr:hypothetical protein [Portunus trituberculatus]
MDVVDIERLVQTVLCNSLAKLPHTIAEYFRDRPVHIQTFHRGITQVLHENFLIKVEGLRSARDTLGQRYFCGEHPALTQSHVNRGSE